MFFFWGGGGNYTTKHPPKNTILSVKDPALNPYYRSPIEPFKEPFKDPQSKYSGPYITPPLFILEPFLQARVGSRAEFPGPKSHAH